MGNKIDKVSKRRKFSLKQQSSSLTNSLTIPSVCTSPSYHLSVKKSGSSTSSDVFLWSQMQNIYLEHEFLSAEHLSLPVLKVVSTVSECLKRQLGSICKDLHAGTMKIPEQVLEKFLNCNGQKTAAAVSTSSIFNTKRLMLHLVKLLYVHDLIIEDFRQGKVDQALELIKQVSVSHALMGITPTEFRLFDWFIIHYLIKNKITNDESLNNLMIYLNTVSNYITKFYVTQSVRYKMIANLTTEKKDDRSNKARENFRLMRKWKQLTGTLQEQENYTEQLLLKHILPHQNEEDVRSIDTMILKENDFIMKHFVKK